MSAVEDAAKVLMDREGVLEEYAHGFAQTLADAGLLRPDGRIHEEVVGTSDCAPDCDERSTCPTVGVPGHWQCGMCPEHHEPRHHCSCLAMEVPS